MKRLGAGLAAAFLATLFVGCDSGNMSQGMPTAEEAANPQAGFADMMKNDAKNMQLKGGRPKNAGKASPANP